MADTERTIEVAGADVETAIARGLADLGVERDEVGIEVLDQPSRGVFGLGARDARVRLTVKSPTSPPQPAAPTISPQAEPVEPPAVEVEEAEVSRTVLSELLAFMGIDDAQVDVRRAEPAPGEKNPPLVLDVTTATDELIGHRGETLAALQRITRLIIGREQEGRVRVVVDVNGFKVRRERSLRRLALRLAEQAVKTDRTVVLEPMPPHERRIIHLALRDDPRVTTESIGDGNRRKVTIIPQY